MSLHPCERDALWLYAAFSVAALVALFLPLGSMGLRICLLVIAFNVALPWVGHWLWISAWLFLLPLSLLQVFPDWFLSAQLGVLVFPDIGAPMIGTVSAFMGLMWVIPLFMVVLAAEAARTRANLTLGVVTAGLTALLIFAGSEMFSWRIPLWYARDVSAWQHMALYVLPAEFLLGIYTYAGYRLTLNSGRALKLAAAGSIMLLYLGALAFFYLLIETI